MSIASLLAQAARSGGRELILSAGQAPRLREHAGLTILRSDPIPQDELRGWLGEVAEVAHGLDGSRWRVRALEGIAGLIACCYRLPEHSLTLASLGLPAVIESLANGSGGLILVSGNPQSGRSSTCQAVAERAAQAGKHVVFLEGALSEPLEHRGRGLISHRRVSDGRLVGALSAAAQADADLVIVDAPLDGPVVMEALRLAALDLRVVMVLSGCETSRALENLVALVPEAARGGARSRLAQSLRAALAQTLVTTIDGGQVLALELLLRGAGLVAAILDGKPHLIKAYLEAGRDQGMQTLDEALLQWVKRRRVSVLEAGRHARDRSRFIA